MTIETTRKTKTDFVHKSYDGYRPDVIKKAVKHGWGAVDFRLEWIKNGDWAPNSQASFFRDEAILKVEKYASLNEVVKTEVTLTPEVIRAMVEYAPDRRICLELYTDAESYSKAVDGLA